MSDKPKILILCTGNSCRSQMAEGILRAVAGDLVEVYSAGSKPAGYVHPKAVQVLQEIGSTSPATPRSTWRIFLNRKITTVITVCGNADQACPMSGPGESLPTGDSTIRPTPRGRKRRSWPSFAGCGTRSALYSRPMPPG